MPASSPTLAPRFGGETGLPFSALCAVVRRPRKWCRRGENGKRGGLTSLWTRVLPGSNPGAGTHRVPLVARGRGVRYPGITCQVSVAFSLRWTSREATAFRLVVMSSRASVSSCLATWPPRRSGGHAILRLGCGGASPSRAASFRPLRGSDSAAGRSGVGRGRGIDDGCGHLRRHRGLCDVRRPGRGGRLPRRDVGGRDRSPLGVQYVVVRGFGRCGGHPQSRNGGAARQRGVVLGLVGLAAVALASRRAASRGEPSGSPGTEMPVSEVG